MITPTGDQLEDISNTEIRYLTQLYEDVAELLDSEVISIRLPHEVYEPGATLRDLETGAIYTITQSLAIKIEEIEGRLL